MLARGDSYSQIRLTLACNRNYISRWKQRFVEQRLSGLYARHRGRAVAKQTPKLEARVLAWTRKAPPDGSTHWSTRKLAQQLGINHMMVGRVWKRASLRPHRLERYLASNDSEFEAKAADIIGLYVHPRSMRLCFASMRNRLFKRWTAWIPSCHCRPAGPNATALSTTRHGTLSLYAALNTRTGEVLGKTADRHTSQEFVAFLADLVTRQPTQREIHVIVDNLSAHKTPRVEAFLADHPHVRLHFTPTYSSWLNQVELWFAKIERDLIARGIFTSVRRSGTQADALYSSLQQSS